MSDEEREDVVVESHNRRKPGRKPLPPELPRVEVIHDLPESEKVCECGAPLSRIGEDVCEKLDIIPARYPGYPSYSIQIYLQEL